MPLKRLNVLVGKKARNSLRPEDADKTVVKEPLKSKEDVGMKVV